MYSILTIELLQLQLGESDRESKFKYLGRQLVHYGGLVQHTPRLRMRDKNEEGITEFL